MTTRMFLFHPHMDQSRVNKALANAAEQAGIEVRNIYDLYPDFKIDVEQERQVLADTDRIAFQFPFYWYSSPALMKQYEDDVFTGNWAYNGGNAIKDHEWLLAVSTGSPKQAYQRNGRHFYLGPELLRPYQATNHLIQTKFCVPFISYADLCQTDADLQKRAQAYVDYLQTAGPLPVQPRDGINEK